MSAAASAVDSAERSGSTSRTRRTALQAANVPSEKSAMRRGPAAASSRAAATSARGAPACTSAAARPPPLRARFPSAPAAFARLELNYGWVLRARPGDVAKGLQFGVSAAFGS